MSDERRQSERHQLPTVLLRIESAAKLRHRYLRDLSEGGLFIQTKHLQPVDSEIAVQIVPPGAVQPLELKGTVVRVAQAEGDRPGGMGVRFLPTDAATQAALRSLLAEFGQPLPGPEGAAESRPPPADPLAEVDLLRNRLRCADAQIIALHDEIEKLEEDDVQQRNLVEKLLSENRRLVTKQQELATQVEQLAGHTVSLEKKVGELSHEGETAKREFWELSADLAEVVAREEKRTQEAEELSNRATEALAQAFARQEELMARAEAAEAEARATRAELQPWHDHHASLQARHEKLGARLVRLRDSERHLRRMLAIVSGEATAEAAEPLSAEAIETLKERTGLAFDFDPADDIPEALFAVDGDERLPGATSQVEPTSGGQVAPGSELAPMAGGVPVVEVAQVGEQAPEADVGPGAEVAPVGEAAPMADAAPGGEVAQVDEVAQLAAETPEEDSSFDVDLDFDDEAEAGAEPETLDPMSLSRDQLARLLRQGTAVELTSAFREVQVVERDEVVFSCVLERANTLDSIRELAKERFGEDQIIDLLFAFYERGQVTVAS